MHASTTCHQSMLIHFNKNLICRRLICLSITIYAGLAYLLLSVITYPGESILGQTMPCRSYYRKPDKNSRRQQHVRYGCRDALYSQSESRPTSTGTGSYTSECERITIFQHHDAYCHRLCNNRCFVGLCKSTGRRWICLSRHYVRRARPSNICRSSRCHGPGSWHHACNLSCGVRCQVTMPGIAMET
jgi:hypothetical protein